MCVFNQSLWQLEGTGRAGALADWGGIVARVREEELQVCPLEAEWTGPTDDCCGA